MDKELTEALERTKIAILEARYIDALNYLRNIAQPSFDFPLQHKLAKLFSRFDHSSLGLRTLKIAIIPTSTVDHFVELIKFWLGLEGFMATVFVADFGTLHQTILDPQSPLYVFEPDIIWLFTNLHDLEFDLPANSPADFVKKRINEYVEKWESLWAAIKANSNAHIIQNNLETPLFRPFGNLEGGVNWAQLNVVRAFNLALSTNSRTGISIFDIDYLASVVGKGKWIDERFWFHSKHAFNFDVMGFVAAKAARLIRAIKGESKKCLVLDLDNTLWGGVIGDDGLSGIKLGSGADGEAFLAFQAYIKCLKERGIILAVCSKNEEENAKLPFLEHPCMQLKLEDISVFCANWEDKASNIRKIAETLDIGLDSMVFIDDNPAERNLVRLMLPMVAVPEMPEDPCLFVRILDDQNYFEATTFSSEDQNRSAMYQANAYRKDFQQKFSSLSEFLESLNMEAFMGDVDEFHLPRATQLINKSNQFHLTTTRYTESQIESFGKEKGTICKFFKLKDRFGDNGLISVIILKPGVKEGWSPSDLLIDTWVMSCRVLSRGMEEFIQNEIVSIAQKLGYTNIIGKYLPTKKNQLVSELYSRLGYVILESSEGQTLWEFKLSPGPNTFRHTYIKKVFNC